MELVDEVRDGVLVVQVWDSRIDAIRDEVSAVLPSPLRFSQHRVKRGNSSPERVVRESQLIAAIRAGPVRH